MNHSMVPYLWISSDPTPNKNVLAQPLKKHCQKAGYSKEYWSFPIFQRPPIFVRCQSFKPRNWSLTVCHIQDYWHGLFRVKCLNYRFTKVIHRRLLIPFVGIGFLEMHALLFLEEHICSKQRWQPWITQKKTWALYLPWKWVKWMHFVLGKWWSWL